MLSPVITSCSNKYSVSPTKEKIQNKCNCPDKYNIKPAKEEIQNECNRRAYQPEIPLRVEGNILNNEF